MHTIKKLLAALLLGCSANAYAQSPGNLNTGGCGTVTSPSQLQEVYDFVQHNPAAYAKGTAGPIDTIPLSIHIVGTDIGGGYYSVDNLLKVICQLNEKYAPVGFFFYVKWPIQYINNSNYFIQDYWSGEDMMRNNNVAGTVNAYFVQDPAGNCGYYTYGGDAVSIGKNCAGNNSTTLIHELGHFFSLPHTFSGWENGNTPSNPERVRRTGVGSNCNNAGDGFCDTEADYVSTRWSCPYTVIKYDANGELYHIDSSMYMSYSSDACQSRFSNQQMAKMQNNLHNANNRAAINAAPVPAVLPDMSAPHIIYPTTTQYANGQMIVWNKVPGAEYYFVSIRMQNNLEKQTVLVSDTSLALSFAPVDRVGYKVSISPVNKYNFCRQYVTDQTYTYSATNGSTVGVAQVNGNSSVTIYPNPLGSNGQLSCEFKNLPNSNYTLSVMNMNGQLMHMQTIVTTTGNEITNISLPQLASGIYFVRCSNGTLQFMQKLVVTP